MYFKLSGFVRLWMGLWGLPPSLWGETCWLRTQPSQSCLCVSVNQLLRSWSVRSKSVPTTCGAMLGARRGAYNWVCWLGSLRAWVLGFVGYKSCVGRVLGSATSLYHLVCMGIEGKGIGNLCGLGLTSIVSKVQAYWWLMPRKSLIVVSLAAPRLMSVRF
jgi:hypothetical protein